MLKLLKPAVYYLWEFYKGELNLSQTVYASGFILYLFNVVFCGKWYKCNSPEFIKTEMSWKHYSVIAFFFSSITQAAHQLTRWDNVWCGFYLKQNVHLQDGNFWNCQFCDRFGNSEYEQVEAVDCRFKYTSNINLGTWCWMILMKLVFILNAVSYTESLASCRREVRFSIVESLRPSNASWHHRTWANIGSGNGMLPAWCQATSWTNADLIIGPYWWNLNQNVQLLFKTKYIWRYCLQPGCHLVQASMC